MDGRPKTEDRVLCPPPEKGGKGEKEKGRKGEKEKRREGEKEKRRKGEKEKRRIYPGHIANMDF
jgi:hypothetical protein